MKNLPDSEQPKEPSRWGVHPLHGGRLDPNVVLVYQYASGFSWKSYLVLTKVFKLLKKNLNSENHEFRPKIVLKTAMHY